MSNTSWRSSPSQSPEPKSRCDFHPPSRSFFESLRTNGVAINCLEGFPFVLSLSKHEREHLKTLALRQAQGERSMLTNY